MKAASVQAAADEVLHNLHDFGPEKLLSDAPDFCAGEGPEGKPRAPMDLRYFLTNSIPIPGHLHALDGSYARSLEIMPDFKMLHNSTRSLFKFVNDPDLRQRFVTMCVRDEQEAKIPDHFNASMSNIRGIHLNEILTQLMPL